VVLTSNRTREMHDAPKRRGFYHWIDYPDAMRERAILKARVPWNTPCESLAHGRRYAACASSYCRTA